MKELFTETLPEIEISTIRMGVVVNKLFEKLRPFYFNSSEGGPSVAAADLNTTIRRIQFNSSYNFLMLETILNQLSEEKMRKGVKK